VLRTSVDGSSAEERLFEGQGVLSGSGTFLLVGQMSAKGHLTRGFISTTDPERKLVAFPEPFRARQAWRGLKLSPDDRLLAYYSDESGQSEVYLVDFPGFTNRVPVSLQGGQHPEWHPNGRELFYLGRNGRTLMSRKLKPDGSLEEPAEVFVFPQSIQRAFPWFSSPYAPGRDGDRFLVLQKPSAESTSEPAAKPNVRVVMNWFDEFRNDKH
jgi:hypothetical protein